MKKLIDKVVNEANIIYKILFDESHGESWTISPVKAKEVNPTDIINCSFEEIANMLINKKHNVGRNTINPIIHQTLENTDILTIAHPVDNKVISAVEGSPIFSDSEIKSIVNWVDNGGLLFVIYEHSVDKWGSNINELISNFGIQFNDDCLVDHIYNERHPTTVILDIADDTHPILNGIDKIAYYAGCTLSLSKNAYGVLYSSKTAIPAHTPIIGVSEYGKGKVVCIGDGDLFDPIRIKEYDNKKLIINLYDWLFSSLPKMNVRQDFSLFINGEIELVRTFSNIGNIDIYNITIDDDFSEMELVNHDLKSLNLKVGEVKEVKFKFSPSSDLKQSIVGGAIVRFDIHKKNRSELFLVGVAVVFNKHSGQFIDTQYIPVEEIPLIPLCPLNSGVCSLKDKIVSNYRNQKIFLAIPYHKRYFHFEQAIRDVLSSHGFIPIIARDIISSNILLCNICEQIQTSRFALADISDFNANVLYELGLIHALGKDCILLKNSDSAEMSDVQGLLKIEYSNTEDIKLNITEWLKNKAYI